MPGNLVKARECYEWWLDLPSLLLSAVEWQAWEPQYRDTTQQNIIVWLICLIFSKYSVRLCQELGSLGWCFETSFALLPCQSIEGLVWHIRILLQIATPNYHSGLHSLKHLRFSGVRWWTETVLENHVYVQIFCGVLNRPRNKKPERVSEKEKFFRAATSLDAFSSFDRFCLTGRGCWVCQTTSWWSPLHPISPASSLQISLHLCFRLPLPGRELTGSGIPHIFHSLLGPCVKFPYFTQSFYLYLYQQYLWWWHFSSSAFRTRGGRRLHI